MKIHNQTSVGCADSTPPELDAGAHPDQQEPSEHDLHAEIARLNRIIQTLMNRTEHIASTQEPEFILSQTANALENRVRQPSDEIENVLLESEKVIRALREREAHFRQLFERHNAVMLLIDHQSRIIVDANPAAAQFYGYPLESLRGMNVSRINAQPESEIQRQRQQAILGKQNTFVFDHRLANGVVRAVESHISTVIYRGRSLFFSIIHDITERKQAEADLRIAATAFEAQEGLIITDAEGVILRVNQAFAETAGYTAEEIVGKTPRMLKSGRHNADFYRDMWKTIKQTGTWQGEIWDRRKNGEIYPKWLTITAVKGDDGLTTHYVGSHIDITERKAADEKIKHLAFYDSLTGLPNRRLLMDRLGHALASSARTGKQGALLFIDMDNFKSLNDTLGHDVGDLLLQQVAQRLTSCVREVDTVSRLGGDEFMVVLENLGGQALEAASRTEAITEQVMAALNRTFQLGTYQHHCTPSIGATLFNGHQATIEELMKQADISMYKAKQAGRNTLRFFDPQMQTSVDAHAALESDLAKALEHRQFQLHYQIQVDELNCPLGAETLIRWIHPERGFVSPAQFIPLAEETGLILQIGLWVLETACAQLKIWEQDAITRDLALAVNVSAKQFRQAGFVDQVQAVVQHYGINPTLLKLELTESMLVDDIEKIIATMNTLKEAGIQFSMDDFGTGYSSLQYLKRLPLDQLKIDMSFVRDMTAKSDNAIVQTIIAMAHSLNLNVIAEGVETEEQLQLLYSYGCHHYQGYLFSKPLPVAQFEALLKQHRTQ